MRLLRCSTLAVPLFLLLCAASSHAQAPLGDYAGGQRPATAALQAWIEESEGLVEIPAGTFLIDAPLRVDLPALGYRGIRGANGATRIVMSGPGPALEILGDHQGTAFPPSVEEHTWEKERFPVVSGLEIVGKHPEADGIALCRTMKCTVQNVLIRQCRYGIRLIERNRNVIIADSHIYDCTDTGVFLDDCNLHQTNIIGNHISYNLRAGIRQWRGDVHNVQITGNDIEYNYDREAADDEAAADNAENAEVTSGEIVLESPDTLISEYTIVSNTIQARPESPGANILILGSEADTPHAARTIAISGNIIGSRDKNIVLSHACRTTISGNTIYGGKVLNIEARHCQNVILSANNIGSRPSMHTGSVIYCDGILLEDCSDCLLDGNIVSNHRFGSAESGGAITLRNACRCRVSDCQIIAPQYRGVHVIGGMGCIVSDNAVTAPAAAEDFRAAIQISGAGKSHLIQNNWICSALETPILIEDAAAESRDNTLATWEEAP